MPSSTLKYILSIREKWKASAVPSAAHRWCVQTTIDDQNERFYLQTPEQAISFARERHEKYDKECVVSEVTHSFLVSLQNKKSVVGYAQDQGTP